MKSRGLSREITLKLHQFGVAGTLTRGAKRIAKELGAFVLRPRKKHVDFDAEHGTETAGIVQVGSLDLPFDAASHAVRYQTAISDIFISLLSELPISYNDYVFVDLGSGKGRALLLASNFPFKQIIGVELAPSLHEIAIKNIRLYHPPTQRCHNITSLHTDAARYQIPNDDAVLYLFNPFDEKVIADVLSNVETSLREFPRNMYIVYLKPVHRPIFDRSPFIRVFSQTARHVTYQSADAMDGSVDYG